MAETAQAEKRPLDELMLAMDVVDTLRHRQLLVQRELNAEERDEKLLQRLREIYASQGMDVPDHVLAEGVAALREERFAYKPPEGGVAVRLARLYIERGKWFKRLAALAGVLVVAWLAYAFLVKAPAERRLQEQVAALNGEIRSTSARLEAVARDAERIAAELSDAPDATSEALRNAAQAQMGAAQQALQETRNIIDQARELEQRPDVDTETYAQRADQVSSRLTRQEELIAGAERALESAKAAARRMAALAQLPKQLAAERDAVLAAAKELRARTLGQEYYERGESALRAGDVEQAELALTALAELRVTLAEEYTLRIVARPGELSGLWRIPERNPNARNYYIIVEAVAPNGEVLAQNITNEEDGRTTRVKQWGLRVDEHVFNRVRADKQDDGIIQDNRVGVKKAGYLKPDYRFSVQSGALTRW